jgi:type IV fimbrial biogenesis protein FimT
MQPAITAIGAPDYQIASLAQACLGRLCTMEMAAKSNTGRRCSAGFTMLELVTVMGIVGILMAIAIPSFKYVTTANRITAEVNGLLGDMQFARAEAVKEGWPVVVCASANSTSATPSCSNTNTWHSGWIICSDKNNSGTCDPTDPVYRIQKSFAATNSTDTFVASGNTSAVTFNREGFATGLAATVTVVLHSAPAVSSYTRCLAITAVGTLSVQKALVGACT